MKRLYWRPHKCSPAALAAIAVLAVAGMATVELWPVGDHSPLACDKHAAAQLASNCLDVIRQERLARGHALDPELDPTCSGLIGLTDSPVTSVAGHLASKQASVNPNFAAAVVQMLHDAGVQPGDRIAVGYTGSLPAMNVAVCAACEVMGVEPMIIASASSSQFGANFPDLLWVDMERILAERGLIHFRSHVASMGGYQDRGLQFSATEQRLIRQAIERSGLELLAPADYRDSIHRRMAIYDRLSAGRAVKAYVNVGGGSASVGKALGKQMYRPGLNLTPPPGATDIDSVMTRFAAAGVPVIHLVEVHQLARQYDLPTRLSATPAVGTGRLFGRPHPSRLLAALVLAVILLALRGIVLTDRGWRFSRSLRACAGRAATAEPEWMV